MTLKNVTLSCLFALMLAGCASEGGGQDNGGQSLGGGTRAEICKSGDTPISSPNQCLQDDAACYQLTNDSWCTGVRGSSCPAGSNQLPAGTSCPGGARCFNVSESVSCIVDY